MRTLSIISLIALLATSVWSQGISHSDDFAVAVRKLAPEVRIKESIVPVSLPLPEYPTEFIRAGISGEVSIRFFVGEDGNVSEIAFLKVSQREFVAPVREAVARWKFQAYTSTPDGVKTTRRSVWMACLIQFRHEEE
jgi:TonB family protein